MRADVAPTQAQQLCSFVAPVPAKNALGLVERSTRCRVRDKARSFDDVFDGFRFRGDR